MEIKSEAEMQFKITLDLTESEANALFALTKYGSKAFLETFYTQLGKSSLSPFEKGLISLFETASRKLPKHFERINRTKAIFSEKIKPLN